jgi:hypothetical protein
VKANKNDFLDAEAIAGLVERRTCASFPSKTDDQLDLQAIYRVRDRLISLSHGADQPAESISARTGHGVCAEASETLGRQVELM